MPLNIVSIVGARPQFVKLAPVARAIATRPGIAHSIIHTGQHYDQKMSAVFFEELDIPHPDVDLGIGSGTHAEQTAGMLLSLERRFDKERPDLVIVYGDTNSTLAATLAASKIHIPIVHVEAGLRSFNRAMPEEINRLVADHCSDRLYAPTPVAMKNLADENLSARAVLSGDVMRDAVMHNHGLALERSAVLERERLEPGHFVLLTIHRPVNTTQPVLAGILDAIRRAIPDGQRVVFPVHPRTRPLIEGSGLANDPSFIFIEPVAYLDMLRLVDAASLVVTDSGGVQKEAAFLKSLCVTLRSETEWTETIDMGMNSLVGHDEGKIVQAIDDALSRKNPFDSMVMKELDRHFGSGHAGECIVDDIAAWSRVGDSGSEVTAAAEARG